MITCFTYWNNGITSMPPMIKYIYDHNNKKSKYYNFNLILLTDDNIQNYIKLPSRFWDLDFEFKSEIIRFFILDLYGGIWLNPDVIIIKDLNILYNKFIHSRKQVMLDIEFHDRIGCSSILMLPNSKCSRYCINYINNILDTVKNILWDDIGHNTVTSLYETYPNLILLNDYEKVKKGTNIICWNQKPGFFKNEWLKNSFDEAQEVSNNIIYNPDCYYVITWNMYNVNDINDINSIFVNKHSIFYYLTNIVDKKKVNNFYNKILYIIIFIFIVFYLYYIFIYNKKLN